MLMKWLAWLADRLTETANRFASYRVFVRSRSTLENWQILSIDGRLWVLGHAVESARMRQLKRHAQESVQRAAHPIPQTFWKETRDELFRAHQRQEIGRAHV